MAAPTPPAIEDSFEKLDRYPTVVERYYSQYHFNPPNLPDDELHCVLIHTNRICLLTLAETHPLVRHKKKITKIDFKVTEKLDRLKNKVVGKGKKGAQNITPGSPLCFIDCSDGSRYTVLGCIKSKLVEININLLTDYELLVNKPLSQGYIAILLPNLKDIEEQKKKLVLYQACLAGKTDDIVDADD